MSKQDAAISIRVHKIRLLPNNKQRTYCARAAGVARFAYNWALATWQEQYKNGQKPTEAALRKLLNSIKESEYPWMLKVTKVAPQQAIKNLGEAFKRFWSKKGGYPKFKRKGEHDSFRADNGPAKKGADAVKVSEKCLKLPKIGWIRLTEEIRFTGQIKSVTVSKRADHWYAAITVDIGNKDRDENTAPTMIENQDIVGVDLGLTTLATLSNGEKLLSLKPYNHLLSRVRRYARRVSRRVMKSKNRAKAKRLLARLHKRITDIRLNAAHQLTSALTKRFKAICIEDLNVDGMRKNRRWSRHIMDVGFYEIRRQLEYKCKQKSILLEIADRFFPSSKLCSSCKSKNSNLQLSDRKWNCDTCNVEHDRDINAAQNLRDYMLEKIRQALPELTLVESSALAMLSSDTSETVSLKQEIGASSS